MVGSTGRRKHMRRLQHVPYSLGCMLMDTLMLTWLSTRFEATAHSAVRGKELGEVECHKWRHHEVVVDILPTAPGSEKCYSYSLRLFMDVLSAVFDGCHHPRCTGSEYEAHYTLRKLENEL